MHRMRLSCNLTMKVGLAKKGLTNGAVEASYFVHTL